MNWFKIIYEVKSEHDLSFDQLYVRAENKISAVEKWSRELRSKGYDGSVYDGFTDGTDSRRLYEVIPV